MSQNTLAPLTDFDIERLKLLDTEPMTEHDIELSAMHADRYDAVLDAMADLDIDDAQAELRAYRQAEAELQAMCETDAHN